VKNAERFVKEGDKIDPAQAKQAIQQLQQALQKVGGMLKDEKAKTAVKMSKIAADQEAKRAKLISDHSTKTEKMHLDYDAKLKGFATKLEESMMKHLHERDARHEQMLSEALHKMSNQTHEKKMSDIAA
jgi:predicted DNA-binding protein YlxM (UPF0122 family)